MALQIFQRTIVDAAGNAVNSASVTVRNEDTGALAPIYTTRAGDVLKSNPIITGVNGFVEFYAPAGEYRVDAVFGGDSIVWRYVKLIEVNESSVGYRNLIINGNFAINQRGYVSGAAVAAANTYTLDRWRVVTSGQNASFTTSGNGRTVTAPAGGLEQVIEGANIGGGTYIINWTGTATCTVGGVARAKGATFTLTANTNATVRFSGGTVSKVQIEPGLAATVFEERPIGLELMLCQRYFCKTYDINVAPGSISGNGSIQKLSISSNVYDTWRYPVLMRTTPTITIYNASTGAIGTWRDGPGTDRSVSTSNAGDSGVSFACTTVSTNAILTGHLTASAEL